jgi:hypothetical protein
MSVLEKIRTAKRHRIQRDACKGNLAVRGNHSGLARGDPKRIYKSIIHGE